MTANHIRERLKETCEFVSWENQNCQRIMVIAGCPCACVDLSPFDGKNVDVISDPVHATGFIRELMKSQHPDLKKQDTFLQKNPGKI